MSKVGKGLLITNHSSRRFYASPHLRVAVSPSRRVPESFLSVPHVFLNPKSEIRNPKSTSYPLPPGQPRSHSQKSFTFTARCGNIGKIKYVHFITILCKQATTSKLRILKRQTRPSIELVIEDSIVF
jgi:hypothetical protein